MLSRLQITRYNLIEVSIFFLCRFYLVFPHLRDTFFFCFKVLRLLRFYELLFFPCGCEVGLGTRVLLGVKIELFQRWLALYGRGLRGLQFIQLTLK